MQRQGTEQERENDRGNDRERGIERGIGQEQAAIERFLDRLCGKLPSGARREDIRQEFRGHLEERIAEREAAGASRPEAVAWAIDQMGDPGKLGRQLRRVHAPRWDWGLLAGIALLAAGGVVTLWSAGTSYLETRPYFSDFAERQLFYAGIGLLVMMALWLFDYRRLRKLSWPLYVSALAAVWITANFGLSVNGARAYISLGGVSWNMIAVSPVLLAAALPGLLLYDIPKRFGQGMRGTGAQWLVAAAPLAMYAWLQAIPTMAIYAAVALIALGGATGHWKRIACVAGVFVVGGGLYAYFDPRLSQRFAAALSPESDPQNGGYMYVEMMDMIRSAGWLGQGFGTESQLPLIYSEMVIPYLIYCFGWGAGLLLIGLVGWLLTRLVRVGGRTHDRYGRVMMMALVTLLAFPLLYGIAVLSGRVVISSYPIPFMSYGSRVIVDFAIIGMILGIFRWNSRVSFASGQAEQG